MVCGDDPVARRARRPPRRASPTGSAAGADVRAVDVDADGGRVPRSPSSADGDARSATVAPAAARACTTSVNATGAVAMALALGVDRSTRAATRSPASAASPAGSTSAASTAGPRSSTTTPTCRPRSRPCSPRPASSGDGWQRVVAVFQPNRYNRIAEMWRRLRRRLRRRRRRGAHRHLPVGHDADPGGHRQALVNAVLEAHPSSGWCGCPAATTSCRSSPARLRPGRRVHLDGLRRHRDAARRGARCPPCQLTTGAAGDRRGASLDAAVDAAADAARRPSAERDVPLGPLTTYRVGGPAALFVRVGTLDDLGASVAAVAGVRACRCSSSGRGSNLLVADAGFAGDRRVGDGADATRSTIDADGAARVAPAASSRCPCWPADGGARAHRLRVGGRRAGLGRRRGADERRWPRLGHRRLPRRGRRRSTSSATRRPRRGAPRERPRPALPRQRPRRRRAGRADGRAAAGARATGRRPRRRSPRSCAGVASNQPGGQNAGSVFVNPVPGEVERRRADRRSSGLRGLRIGTAWVSEKHANFIQADEGGSADDVRA